jgi:hypothetical protein
MVLRLQRLLACAGLSLLAQGYHADKSEAHEPSDTASAAHSQTTGDLSTADNPRDKVTDVPVDPHRVLGADTCQRCHAQETLIWKRTPHFQTFTQLHRQPEAHRIAERLGIDSFKNDANCVSCHYTLQHQGASVEAISGISCESCHGAAQDWIDIHHDYGPGKTRETETPQHRYERLVASLRAGMRNPVNAYLMAQSCYRCHTVPDEQLVNVGQHVPGSLDFELVSWSQGSLHHNFVSGGGTTIAPSSPDRLASLFLAGLIADLEFSLRATAKATVKDTFGVTSAKRAARAIQRLEAAAAELNQPLIDELLAATKAVPLRLDRQAELEALADQVAQYGLRAAATLSGPQLDPIKPFIPSSDTWR